MATPLKQVLFCPPYALVGFPPVKFEPDGTPGDWQYIDVNFVPQHFPPDAIPRVLLTATTWGLDVANKHKSWVPAVLIARNVTPTGFQIAARNSGCGSGYISYHILALWETPGTVQDRTPAVRRGTLKPKQFSPDCKQGDWNHWQVAWNPALPEPPLPVLLTAADAGITDYHHAAAVGIVSNHQTTGFDLHARNSDCAAGQCGFNYAAIEFGKLPSDPNLVLDSGIVPPKKFASDCESGDWNDWKVSFAVPFGEVPTVLLTGHDPGLQGHLCAAVGIASSVTPAGFRLRARNSDIASGQVGFTWVAIGKGG